MISTLNLIIQLLNKLVSEEALLALFNFLQGCDSSKQIFSLERIAAQNESIVPPFQRLLPEHVQIDFSGQRQPPSLGRYFVTLQVEDPESDDNHSIQYHRGRQLGRVGFHPHFQFLGRLINHEFSDCWNIQGNPKFRYRRVEGIR